MILRDVIFRGKRRYGAFAKSAEKISTNILANRLARLEEAGILARSPDPDSPTRPLYALTPRGADLIPVLLEIIRWSADHDPANAGRHEGILHGAPRDLLHRLDRDRAALVAELRRAALAHPAP